jgi:hypothetical protein
MHQKGRGNETDYFTKKERKLQSGENLAKLR